MGAKAGGGSSSKFEDELEDIDSQLEKLHGEFTLLDFEFGLIRDDYHTELEVCFISTERL